MGYRSDIRILVSKKGYTEFEKFVENEMSKSNKKDIFDLLKHLEIRKTGNDYVYFGWDYIKWYEGVSGYEEVDIIMRGLDYLQQNDFSYRYTRIGENYEDIEEKSFDGNKDEWLEFPYVIREFNDKTF